MPKEARIPEEILVKTDDAENIRQERATGKEHARYRNSKDAEKEFSDVIDDLNTEAGQMDTLAYNKAAEGLPLADAKAIQKGAETDLNTVARIVSTAKSRTADLLTPGSNTIPVGRESEYRSGHDLMDLAGKYLSKANKQVAMITDKTNAPEVTSNQSNLQQGIDKLQEHTVVTKGHGVEEGVSSNIDYTQADKTAVTAKDLYDPEFFYEYKLTKEGMRILGRDIY